MREYLRCDYIEPKHTFNVVATHRLKTLHQQVLAVDECCRRLSQAWTLCTMTSLSGEALPVKCIVSQELAASQTDYITGQKSDQNFTTYNPSVLISHQLAPQLIMLSCNCCMS